MRALLLLVLLLVLAGASVAGCVPGASRPDAQPADGDVVPDGAARPDTGPDSGHPVETWVAQPACNRDYLPVALEMIGAAERRVHVVEYVIYPGGDVQDVLDALLAAAARGVEVMVLADEESAMTAEALDLLREGGCEARLDSATVVTHNKLIIADDQVLLGSTNLTSNAITRNNEANLHVIGAEVAEFYEAYFQALWAAPAASPVLRWGRDTRLVPLSDRDVFDAYLSCLQRARSRVEVVLYAMRYDESYAGSSYNRLVEALLQAHADGVEVLVVLDASDWITENHINDHVEQMLLAAGVPLRNPPADRVTHAKLLICDDTVVVSDANWAYSALEQYHGTSASVTDPELAARYHDYFRSIWDQSAEP